jgi:predicted alpha/beta superfamily hydrolase
MKSSRWCWPVLVVLAGLPHTSSALAQQGAPVVIGNKIEIQSKILNETRPLLIATPPSDSPDAGPYPVLYLLDGDVHFHHASSIVRFLAESERIPAMLVVAVPNTNRSRDLTPPSEAELDIRFNPERGGADAFLRFFSDELIPYVEKNYPARPYRILVGHSRGGLFAVHALVTRPELFNAYIVIDPSLEWNNQALLAQAGEFFANTKELQADLYLTASSDAGGADDARKLAALLEEKASPQFRWTLKRMPEETHVSIPHRSIYQGLDTIFDGWHLTNAMELYDIGGLDAIHLHFKEGGERFGYERETSPFTVSMVVHGLMQTGRLEEAAQVLFHDPKKYPAPWNQLDAMARRYAARGDTGRVVHYYTLSLKANPTNDWARTKLMELGVDVDAALSRPPP